VLSARRLRDVEELLHLRDAANLRLDDYVSV